MFASVLFLLCLAYVNAGASVLSEEMFDEMFSKRPTSPNCAQATKLLTYSAFQKAAKSYPKFCNEGSEADQKREMAAFLGQISQETTGWWAGQPYAWGLCFVEEVACKDNGCPQYTQAGNTEYPPVPGKSYHGRGAIQITWNYNYGRVSENILGDKNILLKNPEKLIEDGVLAFKASLDFWMTPVENKPSCHDIIINKAPECPAKGRFNGYGGTTNVINGGLECNKPTPQKVTNRVEYYKRYAGILGVSPGDHLFCDQAVAYNAGGC